MLALRYGRPHQRYGGCRPREDLWLHVDACVGGYILPFFEKLGESVPEFDFRVPGVRSISADLHKYGYAPKPCSTILWRSQEEQSYHYMPITEGLRAIYVTRVCRLSISWPGRRYMGAHALLG